MKVRLLLPDRDFDPNVKSAKEADIKKVNRAIKSIISTMSRGDSSILESCTAAFSCPLHSGYEIRYRQDILRDCMKNSEIVREFYDIIKLTIAKRRESLYWLSPTHYLTSNFSSAVRLLEIYLEALLQLRNYSVSFISAFKSDGFVSLLSMLRGELNDEYFSEIKALLNELKRRDCWLISAKLGNYNQGIDYVLRRKQQKHFRRRWRTAPSYKIAPNSSVESEDLEKRIDRTINHTTNILAQAAEHVESSFMQLKMELAFYIGCLNLYERMQYINMPICFPELSELPMARPSWKSLYDMNLALIINAAVQNSEVGEGLKSLYTVPDDDQGMQSAVTRGLGQAWLLMQCGMFVGAASLCIPVRDGVFSYFLQTVTQNVNDLKANLMYRDADYLINDQPCFNKDTLNADLELTYIISAMAKGDMIIHKMCVSAFFCPLQTIQEIQYRQDILRDCMNNPDTVKKLYDITVKAMNRKQSSWSLSGNFSNGIGLIELYTETLLELRNVSGKTIQNFRSEGFKNFITMLWRELDDTYLAEISSLLNELKDRNGALISAKLGTDDYKSRPKKPHFSLRRLFDSLSAALRDEEPEIPSERAANENMNAIAQSAERIDDFFAMLQRELAFYVGCLNLYDRLKIFGMPVCIPELCPLESESRSYDTLYDVSLALAKNAAVVGSELNAQNKRLYIITGANQGGKSTFLRSIGQAQLMMQCGMFVGASRFKAPIRNGVFSHFKQEEDTTLESGKLDEELSRMHDIVSQLAPGSLMLFNESFATTNEREGSEICRQITKALIDNGLEVFSVTHLYTYAAAFLGEKFPNVQFLKAQRSESGKRTFKIIPGEPLQTAFGEDLYRKIFETEAI